MISGRLELDHTYERKERPIAIKLLNRFISSPLSVLMLAALTCYAFAFSKEFEFYLFVIIYGTYVGLFCDDLSPLMPLFVFCYITPSASNNPGTSSESLFYGTKGVILLVSVLVAVALIFIRIFRDENMGFRRLFFMRRFLLFGILILGASYMLSGILWEGYGELAKQNLVFAALQFLSIFLLYFVFSATVDWENFNVNYLVWIGIALGFIISFEIFWIFLVFFYVFIDNSLNVRLDTLGIHREDLSNCLNVNISFCHGINLGNHFFHLVQSFNLVLRQIDIILGEDVIHVVFKSGFGIIQNLSKLVRTEGVDIFVGVLRTGNLQDSNI